MSSQFMNGQPPSGGYRPDTRYAQNQNIHNPAINPIAGISSSANKQYTNDGYNKDSHPPPPAQQWSSQYQNGQLNTSLNPNQIAQDMNSMHISGGLTGWQNGPNQSGLLNNPPNYMTNGPGLNNNFGGNFHSSQAASSSSQSGLSGPPLVSNNFGGQQRLPPQDSISSHNLVSQYPPFQNQQEVYSHQSGPPRFNNPPCPPSSISNIQGFNSYGTGAPFHAQGPPQANFGGLSGPPLTQFNHSQANQFNQQNFPPPQGGIMSSGMGNLQLPPSAISNQQGSVGLAPSSLPPLPPQTAPPGPQMQLQMGFGSTPVDGGNLQSQYSDGTNSGPGGPTYGPQFLSGYTQPGVPVNQVNKNMMGGGYPPQSYPGLGAGAPTGMQTQGTSRRLDPDQMPSQIQVIEDDRRSRGGLYQTGLKGMLPPLVTTNFIAEDQGTCNPRFLRSTMYNIPCSGDLLKHSQLPFIVTMVPFAKLHPKENVPPIVDLGQMGPVRCNRCRAYMCPYMVFIDGGRKFQCSFCSCTNEVPAEYFAHLDHTGRRVDCYDRPELCLGAYEFVATADYCKDNKLPKAPAFIFMIDVSYNSVRNGLVNLLCTRIKEDILKYLPKDIGDEESEIRVGFVTYGKELHFYNIKNTLVQPQMMVVSDINDVFVPLVEGFLVKVSESETIIDSLLAQISQMFSETTETEVVLGPVIQAGLDALKSAERSGKLIIFHSSIPLAEAPGKLKNRDDRSLLGTEKEKILLTPQNNFYTKLGQECVASGCSVDLFIFPNSYIDVATIAEVPRLTGGSLYKYGYFQAESDGEMFLSDLRNNVSKQAAFDVVLRLRTSTGIRAVDFYGNMFMSNTTDVELASLDSDKAITIEIKHDDKLSEAEGAYVQGAVLYTSVGGRRRLRVLNAAFNCCTQVADMFRNCELDVLINFMAKHTIRESLNGNVKQVRERLMNQCCEILACYRKNCASPSSVGQLILPECMKLLPVYVNSITKSGILQSENINTDDRSYFINLTNSMNITETAVYFYPRLLPLHELDLTVTSLPGAIRSSYERLKENGVYLLENGLIMFLWIGLAVGADWLQKVFAIQSVAQIDIEKTRLQELDNPLSVRIRGIIKRIRDERHRHMKLLILRQRDKLEPLFRTFLVEDCTGSTNLSYVDFLCHIHKEIRSILN